MAGAPLKKFFFDEGSAVGDANFTDVLVASGLPESCHRQKYQEKDKLQITSKFLRRGLQMRNK